MFIYTNDSIYNMDHIASMSVSMYRGDRLTCPSIIMVSPVGKISTLVKCNTTSQCHELRNSMKECINLDENYTVPEIDLVLISINVTIENSECMSNNKTIRKRTFLVPKQESAILMNRLSVSIGLGSQNHILFDSDILYSCGNDDVLLKKWNQLESFINGKLEADNTIAL